jgi:hypothetical protein
MTPRGVRGWIEYRHWGEAQKYMRGCETIVSEEAIP